MHATVAKQLDETLQSLIASKARARFVYQTSSFHKYSRTLTARVEGSGTTIVVRKRPQGGQFWVSKSAVRQIVGTRAPRSGPNKGVYPVLFEAPPAGVVLAENGALDVAAMLRGALGVAG